jgi:hypothetical protein
MLHKLEFATVAVVLLGLAGSGPGALAQPRAMAAARSAGAQKKAPRTEKPKQEAPPISRAEELSKALSKTVEFGGYDNIKTTLIEALDSLAKKHHVTFDVNERAFNVEKLTDVLVTEIANPNPIPEMKTSLAKVLRKFLDRVPAKSGAVYLIRKDAIEITTTAAVREELGIAKDAPLLPLVWEVFQEREVTEALNDLAEASGLNFVVDPNVKGVVKKAKVSVRLANVPVDTAVRLLADMAHVNVVLLDNVFYLTTAEKAKQLQQSAGRPVTLFLAQPAGRRQGPAKKSRATKAEKKDAPKKPQAPPKGDAASVRKKLARPIDFSGYEDVKTSLIEALDELAKKHHVVFDINDRAFKAEETHDVLKTFIAEGTSIPAMKASLARVLQKILDRVPAQSGAVFLIRQRHVEITTIAAVREELGLAKGARLVPLVWEVFDNKQLTRAFSDLAEVTGMNVVVDPKVKEAARVGQVTARLANVPVDTAVRLLADMAELDVVLLDNVFYVTSPEKAKRLRQNSHRPAIVPPVAPGTSKGR